MCPHELICVTRHCYMCDMVHSFRVPWRPGICGMTHSYVWRDSFTCVTWHAYSEVDVHWFEAKCHAYKRVTWHTQTCHVTYIRIVWYMCHDEFKYVTRLVYMCDMIYSIRGLSFSVICSMTHSYVWCDTFTCMTWRIHPRSKTFWCM